MNPGVLITVRSKSSRLPENALGLYYLAIVYWSIISEMRKIILIKRILS